MRALSRSHELLCISLLGFGTLCLYVGYFTQRFVAESIIHSVHVRYPQRISKHAGYYGQAFHQSVFGLACLIAPTLQHYVASKWTLVTCAVLFSFYYLGFFHVNRYFFYFTQLLMGFAYSLYNNGEGAYIAEHSSRKTVESNTAIETAVGHSSMFFGGLVLFYVFHSIPEKREDTIITYRDFSDSQIEAINGMFFVLTVLSAIIFAFMPSRQQADSIALDSPITIVSLKTQILCQPAQASQAIRTSRLKLPHLMLLDALVRTATHTNIILLCTTCFYFGILISFILNVYPTSLTFTASLARDTDLIAVYSVSIGLAQMAGTLFLFQVKSKTDQNHKWKTVFIHGHVCSGTRKGGIFIGPVLRKVSKNKIQILVIAHAVSIVAATSLFCFSTPSRSTIIPNDGLPLLIQPSRILVIVIAFLTGIGDFTITTARMTMCQLALPEHRNEVFSLTRIAM
ncbi:hypothetical protein OSTOST_03693, partial [Ostertagia ostertagi]